MSYDDSVFSHGRPGRKHRPNFINYLIVAAVLVAIGWGVTGCAGGCNDSYSTGVRTGKLVKTSKKGLFLKSQESELLMNEWGMRKSGNESHTNVWAFSSGDVGKFGPQIEGLTGQQVRVHYKQWWIRPWRLDSDYEVTKIERDTGGN